MFASNTYISTRQTGRQLNQHVSSSEHNHKLAGVGVVYWVPSGMSLLLQDPSQYLSSLTSWLTAVVSFARFPSDRASRRP